MCRQRVSTIRHITERAHRLLDKPLKGAHRDIVGEYSSYGSRVYAPRQRDGQFPDTQTTDRQIDTSAFQATSLGAVLELEGSVGARALEARPPVGGAHCFGKRQGLLCKAWRDATAWSLC